MPRRHDPERRDRIIDACVEVIAEHGVAGTSHRRVAAAADVPLGSMTYHFTGMDELLLAAFERFAVGASAKFSRRVDPATTPEEAVQAVARLITHDVFENQRDLVLTHELYTIAAREPAFRAVTHPWMRRSRRTLERHFDPTTARLLDAFIEGMTIHRALDTEPHDDADVLTALRRLTHAPTPPTPPPSTI
ncbi:TetR family transcriptional regulator [Cellulosimicrobium arenosum]|uniref:TetR family transcriptional regulator n=1 Tax=Cellulosimicrobium arenosum TaxID=2708133 RepID=A0A927IZC5_9MICO|nr:TetR family transcriptional regulator [Cellulosimicrobium arenosum]